MFATICAWRTKSNEAEEDDSGRKGVFLLVEEHFSVLSSVQMEPAATPVWPHAQRVRAAEQRVARG